MEALLRAYSTNSPSEEERRSGVGEKCCAGDVEGVDGETLQRLPSSHPAVAKFGAGAGRLDHRPDQQVADENSVRDQDLRGDRPADKGQEVKTKDHVGRIRCVLDSLAVRLRDDAEHVTKAQDPRHNQIHSPFTTVTESLDTKLRDQDDQTISQSDAALRRMHRLILLGQTETKSDCVMGRTAADACRPNLPVEAWQSPFTTPVV